MIKSEVKQYIEKELPPRLLKELTDLAQKYRKKGMGLFIFGSFAQSKNRKKSDLDLGVIWTKERSRSLFTELYREVQDLPTIRKIDLVDMAVVDESFRDKVLNDAFFLANQEPKHG